MKIYLLSIGSRQPAWISDGFIYYTKRLPAHFSLELITLPAKKHTKTTTPLQIKSYEGKTVLNAIPKHCYVVALDVQGQAFSSNQLANQLNQCQNKDLNLALLLGGAEGLSAECLAHADARWSLSKLTFPHALVRLIVAEAIYRAWTILNKHPYHRE